VSQPNRLATGGRIDRQAPVRFSFNGKSLEGFRGDTLASALLANGIRVVGRSLKYHRPRGIVGAGSEEPNAVLQIGTGPLTLPNQVATQVELYDGLEAATVTSWPSVNFDIRAVMGLFSRLMPPGFYYKTFMWPKGSWMRYERIIRNAAGFGVTPDGPDPDRYDKLNTHCDVLVVGGGPAGLTAAREAGRTGARVILVDEQSEFGGSLLSSSQVIDGVSATEWVSAAADELASMEEVRLLPRSTAVGYYDHNFVTILERVSDHLPLNDGTRPRQRLWRVRAKQVVLSTGAIERPLVFGNNDRPGVMLASAVSTYRNRYAVAPGSKAVVFTNNDSAYQTALDLADAGISVAAVVDVRPEPGGPLAAQTGRRGIEILGRHAVVNVNGRMRVKSVDVMRLDDSGNAVEGRRRRIVCDLVAVSGGWNPTVHLHTQSGGRLRFDEGRACFLPEKPAQADRLAGSSNGSFTLAGCLAEGAATGAHAARDAGFGDGKASSPSAAVDDPAEEPTLAVWIVPSTKPVGRGAKQFVDLQTDTTAADIVIATREGYQSVEHIKRYTTLGMGTDQGKLGNVAGIGVLAQTLGEDIASTGTTTFRPPYTPVTYGAIAGRVGGDLFDPVRKTPIHGWHEQAGAPFENVGQWKRAWYYPRPGDSIQDAVNRESLVARNGVAITDASTLGKIDIQGPDAAEFLNRVYTNAWLKLPIGRCRYGLMLGEDGMVMDDGVTARLGENHYLMHTTTGNAAVIMAWLERWLQTEWPELKVYLTSVTDHWATVSLVGPLSRDVVSTICSDIDVSGDAFPFMSVRLGTVAGVPARVFRISFSGELTYEVNVQANYGRAVWEACIEAGKKYDIAPYGTEVMHVLRAEKGFIIVGQDTDGSVTPIDAGMSWIVSKRKDFLGRRSLSRSDMLREDRKQLVGLLTDSPNEVLPDGGQIVDDPAVETPKPMLGHVTSSYYSAALGRSIAMAVVKGGRSRMGDRVYVSGADGRDIGAVIASPVFYDPEGERQNV
jgi:sarcosine oxidase subunit alpha